MPRTRLPRPDGGTAVAAPGAASGRHRAGPDAAHAPTSYSGRKRWSAGFAVTAVVIGTLGALAPSASAALAPAPTGVGATDPASLFPSYYQDTNGLRLQMCEDGPPLCLAGPDPIQDVHAAGGDAESFYFQGTADVGGFTVDMALEAAYAADGPDQEMVFQRRQATGKGVARSSTFTISDPYGTYTCVSDATGLVQPARGCRFETAAVALDFTSALRGPIGPFLTWDTFGTPAGPTPGFIGDAVTPHKVVGSPSGFNKIQVSGPGITGTCIGPDGTTVVDNCDETDLIVIQGKVQPGGSVGQLSTGTLDFGDTAAPVTKTLTYANVGDAPIAINAPALSGTGAAAYTVTNNCPVAPDTLLTGTRCTIDVTFTPDPGKSSTATLAITDDTPVSPRNVALKGSNLGVMTVSDPAPPGALAFSTTQRINSSSTQNNVVIHNTGNGPLTVASATITGPSAQHFQMGTNNTCTTPVIPDGGCEIGVVFAPTTTGSKTANLRVTDSNSKVVNIPLTGTAVDGPAVAPGAPTIGTATAGNASATVSWTPPTSNGGAAITGYSVRVFSGTATTPTRTVAVGNVSSTPITGLTNGTSYSFEVAATNSAGTGNVSARSNTVTPAGAPATPATPTASAGDTQATVTWAAPSNGGSAITSYTLRVFSGTTQVGADRPVGNVLGTTVTGLINGTAYTFRVAATNALGTSAFSAASAAVTPQPPAQAATAPAQPAAPTATAANASATVRWTAPANGGSAITGYTVRTFNAATGAAVGTPLTVGNVLTATVTGLTNGTAYRFSVAATNAVGTSAQSAQSAAVTPTATNAAPTVTARTPGVNAVNVARNGNITITFSEQVQGVTASTIGLRNVATNGIFNGVVTQGTGNQWIFNPNSTLPSSTQFRVTLTGGTTGIRDLTGLSLSPNPTTWTFTTGTAL